MNWIRIAVGIMDDPSILQVSEATGVSVPTTTGHVVGVLAKLPTHAKNGDLLAVSDRTIEQWALWKGKAGRFASAFRAYLCDAQGVVRSWDKHNGAAIRDSDRRVEMMRERRKNRNREGNVTGNVTGNNPVRVPVTSALTGRDGTGRDELLTTTTSPSVADAPSVGLSLVPESPPPPHRKTKAKAGSTHPNFTRATCDAMYGLWTSTFGAVDYGRFRKTFGPLFTLPEAERRPDVELVAALKSYADLAPMGDGARFASVTRAAECLAAIATARHDHAADGMIRTDAIMRIIHGRRSA